MTKARDLANAADVLDDVSATELSYVNGVTSAIQTQLNAKQAVVSGVDDTEIGYLNGVTSAIQTQIDSKIGSASAISPTLIDAKGDLIVGSAADTAARLAVGTNGYTLVADSSTSTGLKWAAASSGSTFAGCALYNSAAQSTSNATYQDLTFDSESFDTDGFHSTSTNTSRITIPSGKGGKYHISAVITWSSNSTGIRKVAFRKNGTDFIYPTRVSAANGDDTAISISTIIDLSVGDYMTVAAFQNTGGSLNCTGFETQIQFTAALLGA